MKISWSGELIGIEDFLVIRKLPKAGMSNPGTYHPKSQRAIPLTYSGINDINRLEID